MEDMMLAAVLDDTANLWDVADSLAREFIISF